MAADKTRHADGRLRKGHGGLKQKGCKNRYTAFKEMAQSKEPEILERLFALALEGNATALSFVAHKMYGSSPLPNSIGLDGKSTIEQITRLNKRIKSGEISAADAAPLLSMIETLQRSVELELIKKELIELQDSKNV